MKHPLRSYAKLVAAQPQMVGVVYPVVGYGALCATTEAIDTYRLHRRSGRPTDWSKVANAAKEGFLGGMGACALLGPALIMTGMRLPTPTLDEQHKLDFGGPVLS